MKQQAFHRLVLPDGSRESGPLAVRFDEDGRATSWHRLEGEEEKTEWVGGTCTLDEEYHIAKTE